MVHIYVHIGITYINSLHSHTHTQRPATTFKFEQTPTNTTNCYYFCIFNYMWQLKNPLSLRQCHMKRTITTTTMGGRAARVGRFSSCCCFRCKASPPNQLVTALNYDFSTFCCRCCFCFYPFTLTRLSYAIQ